MYRVFPTPKKSEKFESIIFLNPLSVSAAASRAQNWKIYSCIVYDWRGCHEPVYARLQPPHRFEDSSARVSQFVPFV